MAKDISAKTLRLKFHGRIIDHLGIQMYQSPVASVAELIANAWDADAESVNVTLPSSLGSGSSIVIEDDGVGMTYEECQDRYLNVGWCRRGSQSTERTKEKNRPVLGRKGIGKFAGFGIAQIVKIETTSKETGERTVFTLDLKDLRTGEYVSTEERPIPVDAYLAPDVKRCNHHGTKIELSALNVKNKPSEKVFLKSMARRFLLHQSATGFTITINGKPLSTSSNLSGVQFVFPQDYEQDEKPSGLLSIEEGRGVETLSNGRGIRWRFQFHKDPIDDEELRGVSVFAHGKLCQSPFLFNLTGGLGGQQG